jgi:ribosomal protein L37AE/L43A
MRYQYYRCHRCAKITTAKRIQNGEFCRKCNFNQVVLANYHGYNFPRPLEFIFLKIEEFYESLFLRARLWCGR